MKKIEKFAKEVKELVKEYWGFQNVQDFNRRIDNLLHKFANKKGGVE